MEYLLLNFVGNSDTGSTRIQDFYNKPLREQFEGLATRYSSLKRLDYEQFIQACFPVGQQCEYFISMPNFIRDDKEANFYNNIVIRTKRNNSSRYFLPKGMEVILIGDIKMRYGEFIVKGIEFIEDSLFKQGEMPIQATAACAFTNKTFSDNTGRMITVPEYGFNLNQETSVITRDLMLDISRRCYTVSDPAKVIRTYKDWSEYILFREYYLANQGRDGIPFDEVSAINVYVISKNEYQRNTERYDEHILDDLDGIRKDDQIVVTKQFENSERFPLIRVTLDKNKKELFMATVKGKDGTPIFEQKLKRFTRADISLESEDGKRRVSVDERYRFFFSDIEPDYSKVEEQYQKELNRVIKEIDNRYAAELTARLNDYITSRTKELILADQKILNEYIKELSEKLSSDIKENKDEIVKREYLDAIKQKENVVRSQMEKMEKSYAQQIKEAKKNRDKNGEDKVKKLESLLDQEREIFTEDIARQKTLVSLKTLYESRNKKLVSKKEISLNSLREQTINQNLSDKRQEILHEQESRIKAEKAIIQRENAEKLSLTKTKMKDEETVRRYYIYFKLLADDSSDRVNDEIDKIKPKMFKYDQRPEKAKIDRQKKALTNFFGGYVKNPFLSSYLFAPEALGDVITELPEIEFFSQRLNDKQKEAVQKAIASESIFLLQGPPGTGKTEVIAEIAAQFAKVGKRILVSSETHKAIDNVFERLPKIPEIRPLRLIPSQSKKEQSAYSPDRLVDNFYINISDRLAKEVDRFRYFRQDKENFGENYRALQLEFAKLEKAKTRIQDMEVQLGSIKRVRDNLVEKYDIENERMRIIQEELEVLNRRLRIIETFNFTNTADGDIKNEREYLLKLLAKYSVLKQDIQTLAYVHRVDIEKIKEEAKALSNNSKILELEVKRANLKKQMDCLRDDYTDDIITGKEEEYLKLRGEFINVNSAIQSAKNSTGIDISDLYIDKIINKAEFNSEAIDELIKSLIELKIKLVDFVAKSRTNIGADIDNKTIEFNEQKRVVDGVKAQIRNNDDEAVLLKDSGRYEDYKMNESAIKRKITEFFDKFSIVQSYEDIPTALQIIREKWDDLERNYAVREQENREKIPMYERILKFVRELNNDGTMESDRAKYTKDLFENANVFGLTCTSRENFKAESMESFVKYNLDDLDVKKQGIDVVIIDEVSKSSFLDLLIPILYGKTVILVGDHRQLPPMYDLRNLRQDDFEDLDPNIINKQKNDEYTALYEECFFKTLFEVVPERLRVTLTKQYRCHGDIMKVFNHFYGGGLELGLENQNDQKQHGLLVKGVTNRPIIEQDKHIYFIDCGDAPEGFERFGDSTSATNEREARVIIELSKKIDVAIGKRGGYEIDKERGIDKRPSMGVICTYGDQAKNIKRKLQRNGLKNIYGLYDERFIVSTVDDFQGDERDIIFVSMVRNPSPQNRARTRAEFVKKFERINVALSRARRMLIIVGAKDFLSEATIDLPGMKINDKKIVERRAYRIYDEIIKTITVDGLSLKAGDILEGGK